MSIETNGTRIADNGHDSHHTTTSGVPITTAHHTIAELAEHAGKLVSRADRPVRRIRLQSGADSVEIDWADEPGELPRSAPPSSVDVFGDAETETRVTVRAPLVGTLYRAPAPGEEPFVEAGATVEEGQQLAIVEAMKLMNPISAPVSGRVAAVSTPDGELVEYDQVLFEIEPEQE
ncbi:acetyl-CoA carboxylase biotin carboxyl carrier protein [Actinopolyspora sp. H202]|uniref:acetyl-CoA carboxylase biotin carboxyl carrier protein n=1 Tax=Actinopolyspora sp. H202 TaxID=1500456 RepID=UPI003EE6C1F6